METGFIVGSIQRRICCICRRQRSAGYIYNKATDAVDGFIKALYPEAYLAVFFKIRKSALN